MTVFMYNEVLNVLNDVPRTTDQIVELVYPDNEYECDRVPQSDKVRRALRQLVADGKIRIEYMIVKDRIVKGYVLNDGRPSSRPMNRMEQILNLMIPDKWYSTGDITVALYGYDADTYHVYHDRVSRTLNRMRDKDLVFRTHSGINPFGTPINMWKMMP